MEYRYEFGGQQMVVKLEAAGDGYAVTVAGRTYQVSASMARPGELVFELDGERRCLAFVAVEGANHWVALSGASGKSGNALPAFRPHPGPLPLGAGEVQAPIWGPRDLAEGPPGAEAATDPGRDISQTYRLTVLDTSRRARRGLAAGQAALEAQMPGLVRQVLVAEGQLVARGQALMLLEAMKMEIRVTAPEAGTVQRVLVTVGQPVDRGQALIELGPPPDRTGPG